MFTFRYVCPLIISFGTRRVEQSTQRTTFNIYVKYRLKTAKSYVNHCFTILKSIVSLNAVLNVFQLAFNAL